MTKTDILARVSKTLEDEGLVHFTEDDLNDSIQDGYMYVALISECIEKVVTIDVPSDSLYFNVAEAIPDYYRVFAIFNSLNNRWLIPASFHSLQSNGPRWETRTGSVQWFCPLGARHILFHPATSAVNTMYFFYRAQAPEIAANEEPAFFEDCHKILEYYVVQDLLDQNLEYTKSTRFYSLFISELSDLSRRINKRSWYTKIQGLLWRSSKIPSSMNL
jgi:hypothetical protein